MQTACSCSRSPQGIQQLHQLELQKKQKNGGGGGGGKRERGECSLLLRGDIHKWLLIEEFTHGIFTDV